MKGTEALTLIAMAGTHGFALVVGGLGQSTIAAEVFAGTSRPVMMASPGTMWLVVAATISLLAGVVVWWQKGRIRWYMPAVPIIMWVVLSWSMAIDRVEGNYWVGPFPLVVTQDGLGFTFPEQGETLAIDHCGVWSLCLYAPPAPSRKVFVGPLAGQMAGNLR